MLRTLFIRVLLALMPTVSAAQTQTLTVNGRHFTLPADTPILVDDTPALLSDLLTHPPGLQLRWLPAGADASEGAGTPELVFSYTLIGPVTAVAPLEVLGQPVTVTADTTLEGFDSIDDLAPGDAMIVAGLVDANGSLYARLVERRDAPGNKFLLTGYVQETRDTPPEVRIGEQWLDAEGVDFVDCGGGLPILGDYLEVRADAIDGFKPGDIIDTVVSAQCTSPVPFGTIGAVGLIEGIISSVGENSTFAIGPMTIAWDDTTVFEFGGPDDLEPGTDISVEGTFTASDAVFADAVEFVRPVLRIEGPMAPEDVTPGESLRPLGVTVLSSAQVRDEDGILATGLPTSRQVQVRAWLDREGMAFATRVRERGDVDPNDVALRGPVAAIAEPTIDIQGLTVDTTGGVFFDAKGNEITAAGFFADVRINHLVDVGGAIWNPDTRTLTGGDITLLGYEHTQPVPGKIGSIVGGTVTSYGVGDPIFANGFD